ncbi:MAG TPA: Druantia anti-phage system protein DruA [Candidatus Angelobacter sp.]|nr:Druantia anti-phage system protein DruA [Candidatus Angelobacter sp.]
MRWTTLNVPSKDLKVAKELEQFTTRLRRIPPDSAEFERSRRHILRQSDACLRACGLLLLDLVEHGRKIRVKAGFIQFSSSGHNGSEPIPSDVVRNRLHLARSHQLRSTATREFILSMEKRRLFQGKWVSIFSLMRDGADLESRMREVRSGICKPEDAILPYIQVVSAGEACPYTGFDLMSIWRYFRHTWANPYNSVPGRSSLFLIRDAAVQNHPVIGIAALASSAVQLAIRDEWIGWNPETVVQKLRSYATDADIAWLQNTIKRGLGEIYIDDLLSPSLGPLSARILRHPSKEAINWLQKYAAEQREIHHKNSNAKEHKHFEKSDGTGTSWRKRAERALFRSKRAETLAVLLRAKLALSNNDAAGFITAEQFKKRLQSPEQRQALLSLIRRIKSDRVGIALADISVCGAIPPYSALTAGKLIAMLLMSPEVILAYQKRYAHVESVIASSIAGRPIVRDPHLVLLGTTSLYGSEPNQYTRVQVPCEVISGQEGHSLRFQLLGKTQGFGTFQFSEQTVQAFGDAVAQVRGGKRVNSIFGEGVNPRLRKIRDGLDLLGLDSDELLMHGNPRLVYAIPMALNFREYLLGKEDVPEYPFPVENPKVTTTAIAKWWMERWMLKRIKRDDVLEQIRSERLTYPVRHGARVQIPEDFEAQRLPF